MGESAGKRLGGHCVVGRVDRDAVEHWVLFESGTDAGDGRFLFAPAAEWEVAKR